jgi:hypothetical protein
VARAVSKPLEVVEDAQTGNRFVTYTTKTGTHLELQFDGEEPWFTQKDMAAMFGVSVRSVGDHVKKFIEDGELDDSVTRNFRVTAADGKAYDTTHYALDVAFYVGYRVNSTEGKLFRRWATQMLVQLATKGFVVNKKQLRGDPDRMAQLREIIRDLRADEANVYAELRTILSMCKDYDPKRSETNLFFAHFQDCLLYAITEKTSAEIKMRSADASKPNMGLRIWNEENEHPLQDDALSSKNYLGELQLEDLNRLVGMVLDFFEDQVKRGWLVTMTDAGAKLGEILTVNKRHILKDFGRANSKDAEAHVKTQYKIFDKARRAERKAKAVSELNAAGKLLGRPKKKK